MNNYTETYIEYLAAICPNLNAETQSLIINYLENSDWDNPTSVTDFNNVAVIALIEAERCQDLSLRSLYLEMANEALTNGLSITNDPFCAAHLSFLMAMTGQIEGAVKLAWSTWMEVIETLSNQSHVVTQEYIIYFPNHKSNFDHLSYFFTKFFQESKFYHQALMLLSQSLCYAYLYFYNNTGARWLRLAMQSLPDSADLNLKFGVASIMGQQWEGLLYLYLAKELAPTEAKILQSLYLAYRDLGNFSEANSLLELANQFQRQNPHDLNFRWATLNNQSSFTYVQFEHNLLLAVNASFRSIVTSVLIAERDWFEKEIEFWRNQIQPGMTVIDVGANVGVYTFSAAQRVGKQGKVLAVEPFSGCVKCLEETCRVNQFDWVRVYAGAASDREGVARLLLFPASELNELVNNDSNLIQEAGTFEEVACFMLDSLMEAENLQQVDFLKLDAEGHELAVLRGSQKILSTFSPIILYENIAGEQGSNLAVAEYLTNQGYHLFHYQPYLQVLFPIEKINAIQDNLNIIAIKL